ncbi:MAG: 5'/3'-nucleotidase SurE, partial [Desulfovibrio sp.]|nr:5'/3'-nucleotidase SurE [Desulfovibrio sp.]
MDILLSNDDGIRAKGLRALYAALVEAGHTVHVVAPMRQQSGVGHSLTVFEPVRAMEFEEPGFRGLGVYGTPTDCVKLALGHLLPRRPDMVISGINAGANVGPDILYSGTVGAATEAAHEDLPSIAVSHDCHDPRHEDLMPQARHLAALAARIDWPRLGHRRVLNVNYPACPLDKAR